MGSPILVAKFGGTSLASADAFKRVIEIIKSDGRRRAIVVSAPGARFKGDPKVTDLLLEWAHDGARANSESLPKIKARFETIATDLGIHLDLETIFEEIGHRADALRSAPAQLADHIASRGEWLNAKILALALGYKFVDAAGIVCFDGDGSYSHPHTSTRANKLWLQTEVHEHGIVMPGFYGSLPTGAIKTFSRGGSDISGAILASLIGAVEYENWTDVDGIKSADPRIVTDACDNRIITYRELRELSYSGATVIHADVAAFAKNELIPIRIRSTFHPELPGTLVVPSYGEGQRVRDVVGVAGKNGFTAVTITRIGLDDTIGILWQTAKVFSDHGVSVDSYTGIDTITFVVEEASYRPHAEAIAQTLRTSYDVSISEEHDLAIVCTVGEGMLGAIGTSARIDKALADAGIDIKIQSQSASQANVLRGVPAAQLYDAIRAIHAVFFP